MLVSPTNRFIFIHVPKTGGLSIREALRPYVPSELQNIFAWHCCAKDCMKIIFDWQSYFSFGFVRNPWDAQLSMYKYVMGMGPQHPEWEQVSAYGDFNKYLENHLTANWEAGLLTIQSDFLCNEADKILTSYVGRFEEVNRDFAKVCSMLNLSPGVLPKLNQSEHGNYRTYYNASSRALIEKIFWRDINVFGYKF
jgi:hypothetical protein